MVIHGIDYVSWPRLIPPTDIIYYNGPGYRSAHNGKGFQGNKEVSAIKAKWLRHGHVRAGVEEVEMGTLKKRVD